ncbi:MAG: ABC transporter permease [Vampirovibrionales bacterium]|nr:ABC transporter permease [Vampirovibrionales bacterium]
MSIPVYIVKRVAVSVPILLVVSVIGFTLMRYDITLGPIDIPAGILSDKNASWRVMDQVRFKNPIDPMANLKQNPAISKAALDQETRRLGLDKPMHVQYWLWLTSLLQFHPEALFKGNVGGFFTPDLGKTFNGEEVFGVIVSRAGNTLLLNVFVLFFAWLIAIPIGIYAALNWRKTSDRLMTTFTAFGMSFPSFVLALLAAVFAVQTGWFPLGGIRSESFDTLSLPGKVWDILHHLILPGLVLTVGGLSSIQRQMRGNLLDVLAAEYIRTARAKGLPENQVIYRHAVRTAINPLVTLFGYELAALLSGALLVETTLNFPGLGQLMYKSVIETDTNLVMASLLMSSALLVLGNLASDILLKFVDPRIELD